MATDGKMMPLWSEFLGMLGLGATTVGLHAAMRDREKYGTDARLQRVADCLKMTEEVIYDILEMAADRCVDTQNSEKSSVSPVVAAALAFVHFTVSKTRKDIDAAKQDMRKIKESLREGDGEKARLALKNIKSIQLLEQCVECHDDRRRIPVKLANEITEHLYVLRNPGLETSQEES